MKARRLGLIIALLLAFFCAEVASSAAAPPANDNFENSEAVAGFPVTVSGSTTDATLEPGEPNGHHINIGTASVWFSWVAPTSEQVVVDACQYDAPTRLFGAAYTGDQIGSLEREASGGNGGCYFTLDATAGVTYRIGVSSPYSQVGDFVFKIRPFNVPSNDDFADAQVINGPSPSTPGMLIGSTIEAGEPAEDPQPAWLFAGATFTTSVWYEWTAPVSGPLTVKTGANTLVGVYLGSGIDSLNMVAARFSEVSFTATAGTTYRIAVAGFNRSVSGFVLDLVPPPDTTPPIVNVYGPGGATNAEDITFTFHDTEGDTSDFYCALWKWPPNFASPNFDPSQIYAVFPNQPCTSPIGFGNLPEGNYSFTVYGVDASGNVSLGGGQVMMGRPFLVDRTAPEVKITSGPSGTTSTAATSFAFMSPEDPTARYIEFQCRLDGGAFSPCRSAKVYGNLDPGTHTFTVRAIDLAGNFADATRTWTINPAATSTSSTGEVPPGGAVSTDPVGSGPTTAVPATASIILPQGGTAEIIQDAATGSPSPGFSVVGQRFQITAPDATVSEPLILRFRLDASAIPAGIGINELTLLRNGDAAADCSGPAGTATPDPCIQSRQSQPDGDVVLTVLSSHASEWFIAFAGDSPACSSARSKLQRANKRVATARKAQKSAKQNLARAGKLLKKARESGKATKAKKVKRTVKAAAGKLRRSKKKAKAASTSVRRAKAGVTAACA